MMLEKVAKLIDKPIDKRLLWEMIGKVHLAV
jgi:hypothetical protein